MGDDKKKRKRDDFDEFDEMITNIMRIFMNTFNMFLSPEMARRLSPVTAHRVETFGALKQKRTFTVIPEGDVLRIFIDLRGAKEDTIRVNVKENILHVEAFTVDGFYREDFPLPFKPNKKDIKTTYNNGILEVIVRKA